MFANVLQGMNALNMSAEERREATLGELAPEVKARVERLEKLQEKTDELQKEFEAKLAELRAQYDKKYAPLFKSRHDVVAEGIPDFWLRALQNNMMIAEEIKSTTSRFSATLKTSKLRRRSARGGRASSSRSALARTRTSRTRC